MKMQQVMESPRLKVKWANRHIDRIIASQAALPRELYDLRMIHRTVAPLRYPDCDGLTYAPKESVSKHFGALMGDAVNNLRESMDVWMNLAMSCIGASGKFYFPFSEERKDLESSKTFGPIKKSFPDAANFIAGKIEPCRDRNLDLWAATSLCNMNKHNDFIPTVVLSEIYGQEIRMGNTTFNNLRISVNADKPIGLFKTGYGGFSIKDDLKISAEVTFPKGAIFEDKSVVPTLIQMSQVASKTLDALEAFIRPYCI